MGGLYGGTASMAARVSRHPGPVVVDGTVPAEAGAIRGTLDVDDIDLVFTGAWCGVRRESVTGSWVDVADLTLTDGTNPGGIRGPVGDARLVRLRYGQVYLDNQPSFAGHVGTGDGYVDGVLIHVTNLNYQGYGQVEHHGHLEPSRDVCTLRPGVVQVETQV